MHHCLASKQVNVVYLGWVKAFLSSCTSFNSEQMLISPWWIEERAGGVGDNILMKGWIHKTSRIVVKVKKKIEPKVGPMIDRSGPGRANQWWCYISRRQQPLARHPDDPHYTLPFHMPPLKKLFTVITAVVQKSAFGNCSKSHRLCHLNISLQCVAQMILSCWTKYGTGFCPVLIIF